MRNLLLAALSACWCAPAWPAMQVVIVQGLGGNASYDASFKAESAALQVAALTLTGRDRVQVFEPGDNQRREVLQYLRTLATQLNADDRLVLWLVGHGSYDGETYKFNIGGPDLSAQDLATALDASPARTQLIAATGSSSGALQAALKHSQRLVITGTRGGNERNATRFGTEFAAALAVAAADSDKNGSISAQEAFEYADRQVKDFYSREVRLATEHAVLGGEGAAAWTMARISGSEAAVDSADGTGAAVDPAVAARSRQLRDAIDALRLRKAGLRQEEYDAQLERLLLELATLEAASP